jgi:hypothetical protein
MGVITHARPLTFGTYPSDSLQPGLGPVDPTSHSASHSGPGPLADTIVRIPHGSWRNDAARVVRSSLMSIEVSLATSLYATWIVLLVSRPYLRPAVGRADFASKQRRPRLAGTRLGPSGGPAARGPNLPPRAPSPACPSWLCKVGPARLRRFLIRRRARCGGGGPGGAGLCVKNLMEHFPERY